MGFDQRYQDGGYLADTGGWHEEEDAWKARHVAALVAAQGLAPRTIADIGCGTGGVLAHLANLLPNAEQLTGHEIAVPAYAIAAARATERLRFSNLSLLDETGPPHDLVLAMDVFEHVPDYLGFLELLRPRGRAFAFHIPLDLSLRGLIRDIPIQRRKSVGHLHYFTAETARATLADSGYRIVEERLTHAIMQPSPRGWKLRLRRLPHRALFAASPRLCATILGGCSLLVLAEPN